MSQTHRPNQNKNQTAREGRKGQKMDPVRQVEDNQHKNHMRNFNKTLSEIDRPSDQELLKYRFVQFN